MPGNTFETYVCHVNYTGRRVEKLPGTWEEFINFVIVSQVVLTFLVLFFIPVGTRSRESRSRKHENRDENLQGMGQRSVKCVSREAVSAPSQVSTPTQRVCRPCGLLGRSTIQNVLIKVPPGLLSRNKNTPLRRSTVYVLREDNIAVQHGNVPGAVNDASDRTTKYLLILLVMKSCHRGFEPEISHGAWSISMVPDG